MIASKDMKRPTKFEQLRIDAMMKGGCILILRRQLRRLGQVPTNGRVECHHIVDGNKRLGHLYSIPLHSWYHRGVVPYPARSAREAREWYGASLANGSKAFKADHEVDELGLWQELQQLLGMSDELQESKVYRPDLLTEALVSIK